MVNYNEILTTEQQIDICNIIKSSKYIHKDVTKYLKDNKLKHTSRSNGYIKNLIRFLLNKYNILEDCHINNYDNSTPLTQAEFDVIVGGLLGDTWIGKPKNGKNPCGSFTHKIEHYEYVNYKYKLLKRRCSEITIYNKHDKRSDRHYQQVFCKIAASSVLTEIYNKFYVNHVKVVPKDLIYKLSPLGIAIWFMDDGSSDNYGYKFSVDCFTETEIDLLRQMLLDRFNIKTTKHINQNKTIHVISESAKDFKNLVEPYMCDCMKYKLQIYTVKNNHYVKIDI